MGKENYYLKVTSLLTELHAQYPTFGLARHLSTATADYGDIWNLSDKELFFALTKYKAELELDGSEIADDKFVDKVIEDGKKLFDPKIDDLSDLDMPEEGEEDGY